MATDTTLDEGNWRFEYKYRLPVSRYLQVRNAIATHMQVDDYTRRAPGGKYLVRSLYYDSLFLQALEEKINGDSDRIKYRLRTYSRELGAGTVIRAEMKVRKGAVTEKYGALVGSPDYLAFIRNSHWLDASDAVLAEFERGILIKTQRPQVLVEYLREGFIARDREQVRITFDHQVKCAHARELFPTASLFRAHHPGIVILEIKCIKKQPDWMRRLVQEHGLRLMANSKYVQAMLTCHPALVTPAWSA